ncbi:MAG TPA: hypothetical protein VGI15_09160, partial [Candidatus Cybelea sp.]
TAETIPEYAQFAEPLVDDGRELVELVASGIHPVVRSLATGRHYGGTSRWPLIPGVDAVARTADGKLIFTGYVQPPYGTLAERMAVPAGMRLPLPPGADPVRIAGGLNPGLSSWMPLLARAEEIGSLGTVLILGVTGMAGSLAAQNARLLGAERIVGIGRDPDALLRAATAGAATVALSGDCSSDQATLVDALQGAAPSIVLDFLWGAPTEMTFCALSRRGLDEDRADIPYVQIGAAAGSDASVPAALLRSRRIRISGSGAGSASIAAILEQVPVYMRLIADDQVDVPTKTFSLAQIGDAWIAASRGGPRVVIVPGAAAE